jgi:hypothetical protein
MGTKSHLLRFAMLDAVEDGGGALDSSPVVVVGSAESSGSSASRIEE